MYANVTETLKGYWGTIYGLWLQLIQPNNQNLNLYVSVHPLSDNSIKTIFWPITYYKNYTDVVTTLVILTSIFPKQQKSEVCCLQIDVAALKEWKYPTESKMSLQKHTNCSLRRSKYLIVRTFGALELSYLPNATSQLAAHISIRTTPRPLHFNFPALLFPPPSLVVKQRKGSIWKKKPANWICASASAHAHTWSSVGVRKKRKRKDCCFQYGGITWLSVYFTVSLFISAETNH